MRIISANVTLTEQQRVINTQYAQWQMYVFNTLLKTVSMYARHLQLVQSTRPNKGFEMKKKTHQHGISKHEKTEYAQRQYIERVKTGVETQENCCALA